VEVKSLVNPYRRGRIAEKKVVIIYGKGDLETLGEVREAEGPPTFTRRKTTRSFTFK